MFALAGPVAIGAIAGLPRGLFGIAHEAVATPLTVLGVTALMLPALYIAMAFAGASVAGGTFARGAGRALAACGLTMLGLAAPCAFLTATAVSAGAAAAIGAAATTAGSLVGLHVLHRALLPAPAARASHSLVFAAWSSVALAIGALITFNGSIG